MDDNHYGIRNTSGCQFEFGRLGCNILIAKKDESLCSNPAELICDTLAVDDSSSSARDPDAIIRLRAPSSVKSQIAAHRVILGILSEHIRRDPVPVHAETHPVHD